MKVYRPKLIGSWVNPDFHLVEKYKWVDGTAWHHPMMMLRVHTWCGQNFNVEKKGSIFEDYVKDTHRKKLCADCVRVIKSYNEKSIRKKE